MWFCGGTAWSSNHGPTAGDCWTSHASCSWVISIGGGGLGPKDVIDQTLEGGSSVHRLTPHLLQAKMYYVEGIAS